ncbi:LAME_0F20098g1_1 [Lachancea meyersii CBS 8951]|uniref:LAME_0F20098g1_1 n=1 Tax=Lachancea meyersii CBS 8951 TaxID=1266667 RepID=A0A1G4K1U9_9SACH|nr:LAME_0F20098g1_1 [Lachancea meyersii CBS 8951]
MERSESAFFSQFSNNQIQKVRDAFQFIDEGGDGKISKSDLIKTYANLGKNNMESQVDEMLAAENAEELTFPEFLTIIGGRLSELLDEQELSDALRAFEHEPSHELNVDVSEMKEYLKDAGFDNAELLEAILKQYSVTQLSGERIFKGRKFLNTVE